MKSLTTPALALLAVAATFVDGALLELHRGGAIHRFLTCHFTHWSYEQLAWDAFAFLLLGIACERRNRAAFHATLLASAVVIPIAVFLFAPNVTAYRGLSGIDSALFALLLTLERKRSPMVMLCAVAFAAKIAFELTTGSAVFVSDMGADVVAVPIAHLAGALVAVAIATSRGRRRGTPPAARTRAVRFTMLLAPLVFASCVSVRTPGPETRLPRTACSSTDITGVWTHFQMTNFGPTWSKVVFHRDCRFFGRNQLIWARFSGTGNYAINGKTIRLIGRDQEKTVTFERKGKQLTIDYHGDRITYTRSSCAWSSSC